MIIMTQLEDLRKSAAQLNLSIISDKVLGLSEFALWTGSTDNKHHYEKGGLLRHTHEVVTLCMRQQDFFAEMGNHIPIKPLFLAALFHDVGKIYDYRPVDTEMKEWEKTTHAREIHHISRSAIIWSKAVAETGLCTDIEDEVLHAILAHHGQREWGSPVAPHTKVAWLLHLCDGISARMDDCDKVDMLKLDKKD